MEDSNRGCGTKKVSTKSSWNSAEQLVFGGEMKRCDGFVTLMVEVGLEEKL